MISAPMTPEGMIPGLDGQPTCPTCLDEDCTGCPNPLAKEWAEYDALNLPDIRIRPAWLANRAAAVHRKARMK